MKQLLFLLMFALCGSWASATQPVGYTEIEQWFENNPTKARALFTGQISEEECPPFFDVEKLALYAQEYVYLQYINKKKNKAWTEPELYARAVWNVLNGNLHFVLDMVGLVPIIGEPADFVNGAWYLYKGNYTDATLSFAGMTPIAGWLATGGKYLLKAVKTTDGVISFLKISKKAGGLIDFGNPNQLGKILKTEGTTLHAHHIVPWSLRENPVIQKAAEAGFHMNDAVNGVVLERYSKLLNNGIHANHPAYSTYIERQLNNFSAVYKDKLTPDIAKRYLEERLIPFVEREIKYCKRSNMNLNEYFKTLL